jgi:predicted N-acetyltransferase YhbS
MLDSPRGFVLRPLVPGDAPSAAALIRSAFAALPVVPDPPMSALRVTAADVAAHLRNGGGAVAEADGEAVGCALWRRQDGGLYLGRIAVAPPWRGRGIARTLIAAAETAARDMRLPRLHLSTRLVLTGNRRLFAACGFVETAAHAHPGYATATFVDMEKRLAEAAAVPSAPG